MLRNTHLTIARSSALALIFAVAGATVSIGCSTPATGPEGVGGHGDQGTGTGGDSGIGPNLLDEKQPVDAGALTTCGEDEKTATEIPPDLLILLDRSGSMIENNIESGVISRWAAATGALQAALEQTEHGINWGLKLYPDDDWCGVGPEPNVPVGPGNAAAIVDVYNSRPPVAGKTHTPTRSAVQAGQGYLSTLPASNNTKAMVLVTDGEPNCRAPYDADGLQNDEDGKRDVQPPIDAVALAAAADIPVYVVGFSISKEETSTALNSIAEAGGKAKVNPFAKYYTAENAAEFQAAMEEISADARSCTFELSEVPPPDTSVNVFLVSPDEVLLFDEDPSGTDGWTWAGEKTVEIFGPACDTVMTRADMTLKAGFNCDPVLVK